MGNLVRYSMLLVKCWIWVLLLGAVLFGSATYLISTFLHPVYQASAYLTVDAGETDHPTGDRRLQTVSSLSQLIKTPDVLAPVASLHPDMTVQQIAALVSVELQSGTQVIELDARTATPHLASDLANQISESFRQYAGNNSLSDSVQVMPAQEPSWPVWPHIWKEVGMGAVAGFFLVLLLVVLFDRFRNRVTGVEQVQKLLEAEIMTLIPRFPRSSRLSEIQQTTAEKYRMICSRLNVVQANQPFKLIMFTSASAGEGKSSVASNTAVYLAQMGKQVLLVDLHIHRPELARIFHLSNQPGLTNLLIGGDKQLRLEACLQATETPGLSVLPIGSQPMNSTEQLQSLIATQFFSQLQQTSFDYVVFDSPPLLSVAEAPLLASSMEAVVLVVNGSQTTRRMLMRTRQLLRRMQTTRIIGVVINQSSWRDYADTHLYTLPSPQLEDKLQDKVEQETLEMPAITTMLLPTAKTPMEPPKRRLPDTGETEQVRSRIPEYIIQPTLSLSGLSAPGNGLTRRVFSSETPSTVPQSLPNG